MKKEQENELYKRLKMYDDAVRLFTTALQMYFNGDIEERESPVLAISSRGRALYAIVNEEADADRTYHANYYQLDKVAGDAYGKHPWIKRDEISKLAIKWVFCYMQNKDRYGFAADFGQVEYFEEWLERMIESIKIGTSPGKEGVYIKKTRKDSFCIVYGTEGAYKETAKTKFYAWTSFYDVDEDTGEVFINPIALYRVAAEWVLGILKDGKVV